MDDEYCRHIRENLPLTLQMQLFKKLKEKSEPHSLNISEIINSERRGYSNAYLKDVVT